MDPLGQIASTLVCPSLIDLQPSPWPAFALAQVAGAAELGVRELPVSDAAKAGPARLPKGGSGERQNPRASKGL